MICFNYTRAFHQIKAFKWKLVQQLPLNQNLRQNFHLLIVAIKDVVLDFCWFFLYFIQSKRNQFAPSQFDTCQFHKYRILGHFMFPKYETLMFQQSYKVIKFWHRDRKSICCRLQKKLIPKLEFISWARIKQLKKQMLKLAFSTMETFLKVEKELGLLFLSVCS